MKDVFVENKYRRMANCFSYNTHEENVTTNNGVTGKLGDLELGRGSGPQSIYGWVVDRNIQKLSISIAFFCINNGLKTYKIHKLLAIVVDESCLMYYGTILRYLFFPDESRLQIASGSYCSICLANTETHIYIKGA